MTYERDDRHGRRAVYDAEETRHPRPTERRAIEASIHRLNRGRVVSRVLFALLLVVVPVLVVVAVTRSSGFWEALSIFRVVILGAVGVLMAWIFTLLTRARRSYDGRKMVRVSGTVEPSRLLTSYKVKGIPVAVPPAWERRIDAGDTLTAEGYLDVGGVLHAVRIEELGLSAEADARSPRRSGYGW